MLGLASRVGRGHPRKGPQRVELLLPVVIHLPLVDELVFFVLVFATVKQPIGGGVQVPFRCAQLLLDTFLFLVVHRLRFDRFHVDEVGRFQGLEVEVEVDAVDVKNDLETIQQGPLVGLDNGILEEAEGIAQFLGVVSKPAPIATDTKQQGRRYAVACQYLGRALLGEELVHAVIVVGVDGGQLRRRVRAVVERNKQSPGVTRSAELIVYVPFYRPPLLVRRDAVIERQQHRREEPVADIVQVERADFSVEFDVVGSSHVIGQAVIEYPGLVGLDLIHYRRLAAVL